MIMLLQGGLILLFGIAGGIAVGSGMVAFLIVLDIIPRLTQLTRSWKHIHAYEAAVVLGSILFTWMDFFDLKMHLFPLGTAFIGLLAGCFVGMLAGALTEVINVLPVLAKRMGMSSYMIWLLMAMIMGKVIGSLVEWFLY
jgi:stage V sporulation protein AB